ncbi:MAG TPA: VPLPA-CTERM-specific exosortase XrtD [Gammaproteobacteria bacterium]|nr:VPLPA-CTERM-specific exosortase XrtD [Gammaproteobacteria bacterium]
MSVTGISNSISSKADAVRRLWQEVFYWISVFVCLGVAGWVPLTHMVEVWINKEEYSHGFFIPVISIYLIWIRKNTWLKAGGARWPGLMMAFMGAGLLLLGNMATIRLLGQYGVITVLIGAFIARYGINAFRIVWMPLVFLFFMAPFPPFIHNQLSLKMQLISSLLGVKFIQTCQIPVFLEGNVIDLGIYQLQVAEACNGLRYLFPLFSLSFLFAYLYKGSWWQRWLIFLSAAPLTILLNSFRIGVIGVLVNYWGIDMAEGFLHDFEGWLVFMVCVGLLLLEIKLLAKLSGNRQPLSELISLYSEKEERQRNIQARVFSPVTYSIVGLMIATAGISQVLDQRQEIIPNRLSFLHFPMEIGSWRGQKDYLAQNYLDSLKLSDYILADYRSPEYQGPVNLLIAYYDSQRSGQSAHSPRSCIPGGGWEIQGMKDIMLPEVNLNGKPLKVKRLIIAKGENKQLVYYWFQQRGRNLTNEYLVKWFIFYDSLTTNRTDGALVRLVTPVTIGESFKAGDHRLAAFAKLMVGQIPRYIPN